MKLLPSEEVIITADSDKLTLTNQRVKFTDKDWGQSYTINIFLEDISSIETKQKHYPILLLLAIICVVGGFIVGKDNEATGFIIGFLMLIFWIATREFIFCISSNGGSSIAFNIKNTDDLQVNNLLFIISQAKLSRINQLYKV